MRSDLRRNLGLGGPLFVALFAVASFIFSTPGSHASPTEVATKYAGHTKGLMVEAYAIVLAVVVGIAFFWHLRDLLAGTPGAKRLATVGFGGALIFAASGGLSAGIDFASSDVAKHASPITLQALNIFNDDVASVMGAGGVAAFLIATGFAVMQSEALPRWLGWLAVVLGVASIVLPFASPPGAAIWVLVASVVLIATPAKAVAATPAVATAG